MEIMSRDMRLDADERGWTRKKPKKIRARQRSSASQITRLSSLWENDENV
jgi:hypothetical protein